MIFKRGLAPRHGIDCISVICIQCKEALETRVGVALTFSCLPSKEVDKIGEKFSRKSFLLG